MFRLENQFSGKKGGIKEQGKNLSEEIKDSNSADEYPEKLKKATILQKIRNRSEFVTPALQGLALSAMVTGGLEIGRKIDEDITKHKEEAWSEIKMSAQEAKRYAFRNVGDVVSDTARMLNDDKFISEVALLMASENDKKAAREQIIDLSILVEQAKLDLIEQIQSDAYGRKLAKEMDVSRTAAAVHQRVRINNIKHVSYSFASSADIAKVTGDRGRAYYKGDKIVIPYQVNLKDPEQKKALYETALHEILHESVQYARGLSDKSKEILKNSFQAVEAEKNDSFLTQYYSEPGELIVRKQILDLEMDKLGVKKYGQKFTEKHYQELLILKEEGKLSRAAVQLIDHIKPKDFSKMMNELALNDAEKDYRHADWGYGNDSKKA